MKRCGRGSENDEYIAVLALHFLYIDGICCCEVDDWGELGGTDRLMVFGDGCFISMFDFIYSDYKCRLTMGDDDGIMRNMNGNWLMGF